MAAEQQERERVVVLARALDVTDSTVYFGGVFTSVNGVTRERLAATDLDGRLLPSGGSYSPQAGLGSTITLGGVSNDKGVFEVDLSGLLDRQADAVVAAHVVAQLFAAV